MCDQFVARRVHGLGMFKGDPAGIGQMQLAPTPVKERLAQPCFQLCKLFAQGGLRDLQLRRCLRHAAMARDHPEMPQVVVIQPFRIFKGGIHHIGITER